MIILCVIYYILLFITNKALTGGLKKVTKIRLEQVEETIKDIEAFNTNLKFLKDKNFNSEEKEKNEEDIKIIEKNKEFTSTNESGNRNSLVSSLGFSTETKKIIPLKILKFPSLMIIYIICVLLSFLIPIFIYTTQMVKSTNDLLTVENYIFGNLIKASTQTVEIKCFMSNCNNNKKNLDYSKLSNTKLMMTIIKGIKSFEKVNDFYDRNFLLNACGAAIKNDFNPIEYDECLKEDLIKSGNNTDSLIRLISDLYENIKKEYYIKIENNKENKDISDIKLSLFGTDYFQLMEKIYYKYIFPVGKNFAEIATIDLNIYLNIKRTLIILLLLFLIVLVLIFCIFFGITLIKKLIHYLSVSRCIMKIIPTSVIINTQELESWIENKYSF